MKNKLITILAICFVALLSLGNDGCNGTNKEVQSASGVKKAEVKVDVNPQTGMTVEQENVTGRVKQDNTPGSTKHLYIISPYSGQVIMYSTVKGKVTSGSKRLTPLEVRAASDSAPFWVDIGGTRYWTNQVLGDDGTYGSSSEYIYWFDSKGSFHQHFMTGGQIVHVSSEPISVKSVIINVEQVQNQ
jgi:hypothetical protein